MNDRPLFILVFLCAPFYAHGSATHDYLTILSYATTNMYELFLSFSNNMTIVSFLLRMQSYDYSFKLPNKNCLFFRQCLIFYNISAEKAHYYNLFY